MKITESMKKATKKAIVRLHEVMIEHHDFKNEKDKQDWIDGLQRLKNENIHSAQ